MNFEQMKQEISEVISKQCNVSAECLQEMIVDANSIDNGLIQEILTEYDSWSADWGNAEVYGLQIIDCDTVMNVGQISDKEYLVMLFCGECTDVSEANAAIEQVDNELGPFCVENVIQAPEDPLIITYEFEANDEREFNLELSKMFELFQNEQLVKKLEKLFKYFV